MQIEQFSAQCELMETYAERVVSTSFENWHPAAVAAAFVEPSHSIAIDSDVLSHVLSFNPSFRHQFDQKKPRTAIELSHDIDTKTPQTYFPKLGPISWKEIPVLCEVPSSELNKYLEKMTQSITDRMAIVLSAFTASDAPTYLHLFPYRDFSNYIEARFVVVEGKLVSGRWLNVPRGTDVTAVFSRAMSKYAAGLVDTCKLESVQIDLCAPAKQKLDTIKLLEINPFFTEDELNLE